jgi:hypothetical protein
MSLIYNLHYLLIVIIFIAALYVIKLRYNRRSQTAKHYSIIELRPQRNSNKTPLATKHLIKQLHELNSTYSWKNNILGRSNSFSLEIISTRDLGIRFLVRISSDKVEAFKRQLAAFMPSVRFKEVEDYITLDLIEGQYTSLMEFKQAGHFAFPLATHDSLKEHDPIAYLTGAMTKLQPNELIAYQLVLSPSVVRKARTMSNKIASGNELSLIGGDSLSLAGIIRLLLRTLELSLKTINYLSGGKQTKRSNGHESYRSSSANQSLISVQTKLSQPLFRASLRTLVISTNEGRNKSITASITASFASYSVAGRQALVNRSNFPNYFTSKYWADNFAGRLPALISRNSNVFSVSEVASLYHFPYADSANPENLAISFSRTLPAPSVVKSRSDKTEFDVILGRNVHHDTIIDIGLTPAERERHVLILGGTGNGKTTMMQYSALQDIQNGKGLAVVDPHGDFAKTILRHIPEERLKDVVYINPIDIDYPIGINLLELPRGLSETELLLEKDRVTEATISVMRKVFSDDEANAHRIESLFRNAIRTAFTIEGATLFTVLKLLRNRAYRFSITSILEDEDLKDFWREEFGKAGDYQRVSMSKGITSRMDRFNSSEPAKRMLGQAKSTINFEDILNSGKILICNLNEGELIEDTSALLGTTILAKLKLAAERRIRVNEEDRKPFYLYVDEFQNFATTPFVKMLSSSRKYKLYLTIAQQTTSQQQDQRLTESILANVRTVVCFATGSPADERLLLPQFSPYISKGEIANLAAHNFYIRIRSIEPMEPLSGETVLLNDKITQSLDRVIDISRNNYASKYIPETPKKVSIERPKGYIEIKPRASW